MKSSLCIFTNANLTGHWDVTLGDFIQSFARISTSFSWWGDAISQRLDRVRLGPASGPISARVQHGTGGRTEHAANALSPFGRQRQRSTANAGAYAKYSFSLNQNEGFVFSIFTVQMEFYFIFQFAIANDRKVTEARGRTGSKSVFYLSKK